MSEGAAVEGVTRQAVTNWTNRYEDEGMAGLDAKPRSGGRSTALPAEKFPELKALLRAVLNARRQPNKSTDIVFFAARETATVNFDMQMMQKT